MEKSLEHVSGAGTTKIIVVKENVSLVHDIVFLKYYIKFVTEIFGLSVGSVE